MHVAYRPSDTLIKQKWELYLLSLQDTNQYRMSQDNSVEGLLPLPSANIRKSLDYPILQIAFPSSCIFPQKHSPKSQNCQYTTASWNGIVFFLFDRESTLEVGVFFPLWLFSARSRRVTPHLPQWHLQRFF